MTKADFVTLLGEPDGHLWRAFYKLGDPSSRSTIVVYLSDAGSVEGLNLSTFKCDVPTGPFDAKTWRTVSPEDRCGMARDLVDSKYFEGVSLDELRTALGEPSRVTSLSYHYCGRYVDDTGKVRNRRAGISKCLYIEMDDGRVKSTEYAGS